MFVVEILKETGILFLEMAPYLMLGLFFVGALNLFFNKDLIVKHIGKNNYLSVIKSALFGIPLPLCSCGVVPSAVYMAKNGASKGSVVSFLIATPQTGVDSIIATYGMLGWVFAIFRPIAALIMGIAGGIAVRFANASDNDDLSFNKYESTGQDDDAENSQIEYKPIQNISFYDKFKKFFNYAFVEFLDDISAQFAIGLLISGIIAYSIPSNFFENSSLNNGIGGMLLMILVGAPMYVCATASIPIAVTLMMKGFSPGVAFVFLAVGPATNAASFAIIMNALGKKTAIIYVIMISLSAIIFGFLLDFTFSYLDIDPHSMMQHIHEHESWMSIEFQWTVGAIFLILLIASFYRKYFLSSIKSRKKNMVGQTIKIEGMSCNHCVNSVKKAISEIKGVKDVDINLSKNEAYVNGDYSFEAIQKAVADIGYKVIFENK